MLSSTATFSWADWHGHPSILLGLLLLGGLYLLALWPYRKEYRGRMITYSLGIAVIFIALHSPLHELSDHYLFSAHMVQHLLLMLVAPPLLILGTPGWVIRPFLNHPFVAKLWRTAVHPVVAFLLFNGVLLLWHLPAMYDSTLNQHGIHIVEHLMFMGTAVLMWWPVLSSLHEYPRLAYPWQVLYLFLLSLLPAVIGAMITFASTVVYPFYAEAPRLWGISAVTDQQMGGLIMKLGGSVVFWLVLIIVFFQWFNQEEAKAKMVQPGEQPRGHQST